VGDPMAALGPNGVWEERWHPLREEWVIVAAHRQARPWTGEEVRPAAPSLPAYDPECYLCPGNARVGGARNADYERTFVFDNDHPCVGPSASDPGAPPHPFFRNRRADGLSRVVCFSPRHNLTLAEMSVADVTEVVGLWQEQTHDLGRYPEVRYVHAFENKGEVVGVSNPHPHGQLYATNFVFKTMETELDASARYWADTGRGLVADVLAAEAKDGRRVLYEDEHTMAFVPYFARYAYEVYVVPRRRVPHVFALTTAEAESLARALKDVTVRFDNLWRMSFPYVQVLHQAPADSGDYGAYHFFIAFHPPLRRSNLLKYLAGPEVGGGNFLSDTSPEEKAAELKALSSVHFKQVAGSNESRTDEPGGAS
jgi:UDPglucose--hexose-1-phosphate uridylyltransferase